MNRMQRHIGARGQLAVRMVQIAVTCLLHDEGGWWSPSCVRSAVTTLPDTPLASVLVRAVLAELTRDGRAEVGYAGPGSEPLFRWIQR